MNIYSTMGGAKDFFGTSAGLITAIIVGSFIIVCLGTLWISISPPQNGGGSKLKHRKRFAKKKRSIS